MRQTLVSRTFGAGTYDQLGVPVLASLLCLSEAGSSGQGWYKFRSICVHARQGLVVQVWQNYRHKGLAHIISQARLCWRGAFVLTWSALLARSRQRAVSAEPSLLASPVCMVGKVPLVEVGQKFRNIGCSGPCLFAPRDRVWRRLWAGVGRPSKVW